MASQSGAEPVEDVPSLAALVSSNVDRISWWLVATVNTPFMTISVWRCEALVYLRPHVEAWVDKDLKDSWHRQSFQLMTPGASGPSAERQALTAVEIHEQWGRPVHMFLICSHIALLFVEQYR